MGELQILRAVHEFEDARLVVASMTGHAGRFVDDEVVGSSSALTQPAPMRGTRRRAALEASARIADEFLPCVLQVLQVEEAHVECGGGTSI